MGAQNDKKVSEEDQLKEAEKMLEETRKSNETTEGEKKDSKGKPKKESKAKIRSSKYKKSLEQVDRAKLYKIEEAIELAKKTSYSKFEGSLEVHFRLEKTKKNDSLRGLIQFPNSTGKTVKAALLDEKLIDSILKNKKTDFDILIATPDMMPKIARIAKILGPQGKMPNPKAGTVTTDPDKALKEIQSGRMEFKIDGSGNVHMAIGKLNLDSVKLLENYKVALNSLSGQKLLNVTISATMGPGIKVAL